LLPQLAAGKSAPRDDKGRAVLPVDIGYWDRKRRLLS
jgi:hypothetical protein